MKMIVVKLSDNLLLKFLRYGFLCGAVASLNDVVMGGNDTALTRSNPSMDWRKEYQPQSEKWKKTSQHLIFNNGTEPETLDPALITGVPESRIVGALFEGLIDLDPKTLEPRPGVAESWEVSKDGLIYTFRLRPKAKWSDGKPLEAMDFLKSWRRVLHPNTAAAYAYQLFPIIGAEDYYKQRIKDPEKIGLKVLNKSTLEVRLRSRCHYFLDLVAFHTLFPVRTEIIEVFGDQWVRPENIISNGPYQLKDWKSRQKLVVEKNPHYWDLKFCKLERITILPYDDLDTAYQLFKAGKVHWLPALPLPKLDEIKLNPDYYVSPYLGTYFYRFNVTRPPFNDTRVRKAFSISIDRRILTDFVLKGGQKPSTWFCPPVGGYSPVEGIAYHKELAVELLKEAGYGENGKAFPKIELLYNTSEAHKMVAEAIVGQWRRNLGVNVELRNTEWKVLLTEMDNLNFDIIRSSWIGDYGDPNTFFDMFVTNGGNNRTGWSSYQYDELHQKTLVEADKKKRIQIFKQMEEILVEREFPIIPLYMYVNQGLLSEIVRGWFGNIRDIHPYKYLWLEE